MKDGRQINNLSAFLKINKYIVKIFFLWYTQIIKGTDKQKKLPKRAAPRM